LRRFRQRAQAARQGARGLTAPPMRPAGLAPTEWAVGRSLGLGPLEPGL
jgi:hypothetical protein